MSSAPQPARSWVEAANDPAGDFPVANLPYGVFRLDGTGDARVGAAIGESILDLAAAGLIPPGTTLQALMEHPDAGMRSEIARLLEYGSPERGRAARSLWRASDCRMLLPVNIGDYTDFYASLDHAFNVGRLFRPDNPLLPNYKYVPVGYHGRASSVVVSGTPVRRPQGQRGAGDYGPSERLDYEAELGFLIGRGNSLGHSVPIGGAASHIFGFCLVNDWSARDIQAWEYQPLGPFLGKSFATSISPWVVTAQALAPFRVPARPRAEEDPAPLPYLFDVGDQAAGGLGITLEVWLERTGSAAVRLSRCGTRGLYWTVAQMVAHHTGNGCNLRTGDLIATGTVSGAEPGSAGCLLELTQGGESPLRLPDGGTLTYLETGDEIVIRGRCERAGVTPIGFGECRGRIS